MKTKTCTHCKQEKSVSEFGKDTHIKSGLCSECKICRREYQKKHYSIPENKKKASARSRKWYKIRDGRGTNNQHYQKMKCRAVEYKGGKCCVCGYDKCTAAMDFHHLDPTVKEYNLGYVLHLIWDKLKAELDKCILVCANCHRELHFNLNRAPKQPTIAQDEPQDTNENGSLQSD